MNNLFLPEEINPGTYSDLKKVKKKLPSQLLEEQIMVVAVENNIWALPGFGKEKDEEPILLAERDDTVNDLEFHQGELYDACNKKVYQTLLNSRISEREKKIFTLCSYEGTLYDGGDYFFIHDTLKGTPCRTPRASEEVKSITTLRTHKDRLYIGCDTGTILSAATDKKTEVVAGFGGSVQGICSHNQEVFFSYYGIGGVITNNLITGGQTGNYGHSCLWLETFKDKLFHANLSSIAEFPTGYTYELEERTGSSKIITAMKTMPKETLEFLL